PVDYRRLAKAIGDKLNPGTVYRAAQRVAAAGLAVIVDRGDPDKRKRKATTWRGTGPWRGWAVAGPPDPVDGGPPGVGAEQRTNTFTRWRAGPDLANRNHVAKASAD